MKKLLLIALLVVGCENSTEADDPSITGTYIRSSFTSYENSDCSDEGEEVESEGERTIQLNADGTGVRTQIIGDEVTPLGFLLDIRWRSTYFGFRF